MDQSIEYVKMCNCPEIQEVERCYEAHDFYYHGFLTDDKMQDVWLPRQDQLLLGDIQWQMAHRENDYVASVIPDEKNITTYYYAPTAEQVLLELVMWKLHGKKWNGEEWVK